MEANYRVGQYVLERPLGQGGMAVVWLGRNVHLGTPAAVKFLTEAYAGVPEIEQRFLNEGRRQGALNHPNIIKVYGFEYVGNRSFLILQYIDGEALDVKLRRVKRLPPEEAIQIAIPILSALHQAHEHSIVHRDIKPSNILLDSNGIPYLGDFGIVLATNEKRLTRTGMTMGTSLYMSPEQIREPALIDRRSDLYSLGCVMYEMLAGEPPFNPPSTGRGDTDFMIKLAHVQHQPTPLRQRNPSLSPELEAVVMRCLAKNQADRYQTGLELRDALGAAMAARATAAPGPITPQARYPQPVPMPPQGPVARPASPPSSVSPAPFAQPQPGPAFRPPPSGPSFVPPAQMPPQQAPAPQMPARQPVQQFAYGPAMAASTPAPGPQYQMAQYAPPKKSSLPLILGVAGVAVLITIVVMSGRTSRRSTDTTTTNPPVEQQKPPTRSNDDEEREAAVAKTQATTFMDNEARMSQQLGGEYHTLVFKNKCGKGAISVAATFVDLEGQWVTVGWWKVPEGGTVESGAYSKNRVFYIYAHNDGDAVVWNGTGKPEAHDADVVDNAFVRKMQPPEQILGKNKHSVNMFKVTVDEAWGSWNESFTCGG